MFLRRLMSSLTSAGASKRPINLLRGWPSPSLLPASLLKAASAVVLSDPKLFVPALQYGPDQGYGPLQERIADWLTGFYRPKEKITSGRICITGGASQNLACVLQKFTDPVYTRHIWMIAPSYFLACRIFEDGGFGGRLRAVPEDSEGVDIEYLKREIEKAEKKARDEGNVKPRIKEGTGYEKVYRHIIYGVPTFSNPSSKTMSLRRRRDLVRVAREYDALVITDDVYDLLQWKSPTASSSSIDLDRALQPRIVDVDRELDGGAERPGADGYGNAMSNGSFSKLVGPGCRTGWGEGTEKFAFALSQVGSSKSGGAPSQLVATFISEMLKEGTLQKHIIETLRPAYSRRNRILVQAVEKYLAPLGVQMHKEPEVGGGYFIWFSLPKQLAAKQLADRAKAEESLIIGNGDIFEVWGDEKSATFSGDVRLCFSWEDEEVLEEGVQRMARAVKKELDEPEKQGVKDTKATVSSDSY